MSYGLHTERYEDGREKITPAYNKEKNEFEIIDFESVLEKGGLPTGASFSVSDDGINFTPSNLLTHASRNPSAYIEDGKVTLYCGYGGEGVYESEDMYKPFKSVKKKFDFGKSVMKNSTECPAMFCWNGYKYLIVGFTGYFRALTKNSDELVDAAALGEYIYDGLSVPMVAEFKNNRRLIAGWVHSVLGWGGALMQRELVQFEDGRLGMKWIPELIPQTNGKNLIKSSLLGGKINLSKEESYLFEADVDSLDCEKIAFSFDDGKTACSLELDFIKKRVQINDCEINKFAQALPTPLEALAPLKDMEVHAMHSGITNIPQFAKNYALPDACGQNEHFKLRMTLRRSKKMRGTVLDVELAARKTLISVRDDFFPTSLSLICQGAAKIHNEKLFNISFEE